LTKTLHLSGLPDHLAAVVLAELGVGSYKTVAGVGGVRGAEGAEIGVML
jgi:hypothetical protein